MQKEICDVMFHIVCTDGGIRTGSENTGFHVPHVKVGICLSLPRTKQSEFHPNTLQPSTSPILFNYFYSSALLLNITIMGL